MVPMGCQKFKRIYNRTVMIYKISAFVLFI